MNNRIGFLSFMFVAVLSIFSTACGGGKSDAPAIKISAVQLYSDYEGKSEDADQKYKGKLLSVTGIVDTKGKSITNDPYVTLKTKDEYWTIQCFFSEKDAAALSKVKEGSTATFKGVCQGKLVNIILQDCTVE